MLLLFTLTEGKHYSHLIRWLCFPIFYYQQLKVKKGKVNKNERYGVKMISISELTGEAYDDENMVHFKNYVQSAHYVAWGARLIDLYVTSDMKFVYVFSKEDHQRLKYKWINKNNEYHAQKNSGD